MLFSPPDKRSFIVLSLLSLLAIFSNSTKPTLAVTPTPLVTGLALLILTSHSVLQHSPITPPIALFKFRLICINPTGSDLKAEVRVTRHEAALLRNSTDDGTLSLRVPDPLRGPRDAQVGFRGSQELKNLSNA